MRPRPAGGRSAVPPPGLAAVLVALAVAVAVTADVLLGGPLTRLDETLSWLVRSTGIPASEGGSPPVRLPFLVMAGFGSPGAALAMVVPWLAVLCWWRRTGWPLVRFVVLVLLVVAVVQGLKGGIGRPPPFGLGPGDVPRSYPSGHAVTAVTTWGLLGWTVGERAATGLTRRMALALVVLPPILTIVGMLLLNYHWLTDLLGGAAIGVVLLGMLRLLDAVVLRHWPGGGGRAVDGRSAAGGGARAELVADRPGLGLDRLGGGPALGKPAADPAAADGAG